MLDTVVHGLVGFGMMVIGGGEAWAAWREGGWLGVYGFIEGLAWLALGLCVIVFPGL